MYTSLRPWLSWRLNRRLSRIFFGRRLIRRLTGLLTTRQHECTKKNCLLCSRTSYMYLKIVIGPWCRLTKPTVCLARPLFRRFSRLWREFTVVRTDKRYEGQWSLGEHFPTMGPVAPMRHGIIILFSVVFTIFNFWLFLLDLSLSV